MEKIAEKLKIRGFARTDAMHLLDYILTEIPPRRLAVAHPRPAPPDHEGLEVYPRHVFDIPLSGVKHILHGTGTERREENLTPGEALFTPPESWKLPLWDSAHELFCLVYSADFLRCTYVDYSSPDPEKRRPVCTHFYHTSAAPTPALRKLLHLLAEVDDETACADLARALFRLTRGFLANDNRSRTGKAERTFQEIRQYMAENFCLPLTREETAAYFQLNPNYLSRLFRQRSGSSFSEILRSMRLEHAAFLLRATDLLVDEITLQCGYQSTPFFTSAFHRHFGLPPGQYRLKHKKASGDNADS